MTMAIADILFVLAITVFCLVMMVSLWKLGKPIDKMHLRLYAAASLFTWLTALAYFFLYDAKFTYTVESKFVNHTFTPSFNWAIYFFLILAVLAAVWGLLLQKEGSRKAKARKNQ